MFMDAQKNLDDAIEDLYTVFSRYFSWSKEPGCPCCTDPKLAEPMKNKKMSLLTHQDLAAYASDALLTWGDVDDFKHFLPRIFELCTVESDQPVSWDLEVIFSKLRHGDFYEWAENERNAVNQFVNSWFCSTLCRYPTPVSTGEIIAATALYQEDPMPFLEAWRFANTPEALRQFCESWKEVSNNAFLPKEQQRLCRQFLSDSKTMDWLVASYSQYAQEPWAPQVADDIDDFSIRLLALKKV